MTSNQSWIRVCPAKGLMYLFVKISASIIFLNFVASVQVAKVFCLFLPLGSYQYTDGFFEVGCNRIAAI